MRLTTKIIMLGGLCVALWVAGSARAGTVVIAHSGQAVPEGNGTYATFTDPVLNAFQRLAYRADLAGTSGGSDDDRAIYRADEFTTTLICRENWLTPNANGRFYSLWTPAMNNAHQVVFRGDADDTDDDVYDMVGIYRSAGPGALDTVVRGNDPAPDGDGRFFFLSERPLIDDNVVTTFWASFVNAVGGTPDGTGICLNGWGTSLVLARTEHASPDGNGEFASFIWDVAANNNHAVGFHASLRNTTGGSDDNSGIFRAQTGPPTAQSALVREGDAPPDGNGEFSSMHLGPIHRDAGSGAVSFLGWLRNTSGGVLDDVGVFLATPYGVIRIARDGNAPPDGNGVYTTFSSDTTQNEARVGFVAVMRNTSGGSADEQGVYSGNGLSTKLIARGGYAAPDGNGVFRSFGGVTMNKPGHIAFRASLVSTGSGSTDDTGLFIGDGYDTVQVAREGDPMLGSTIVELHMAEGADCRNGFNQHSQVAYRAVLADGRQMQALFTPTIEWKGGSGSWEVAPEWTLGIIPKSLYEVEIAPEIGPGPVFIDGPRTDAEVKNLVLGGLGGEPVMLELTGAGDLAAVGTFTVTHGGSVKIGNGRSLSAERIVNMGDVIIPAGATAYIGGLGGKGCSGPGLARLGGHIRPGMSTGVMNFAGPVLIEPSATTHIELAMNGAWANDQIVSTVTVTLGGVLSVELLGAAIPMPGESFEIVRYGARVGGFDRATGLEDVAGHAGLGFEMTYASDGVTLTATAMGGDADLNAVVDVFDLGILASNYGGTGKDWMRADFTGEGDVNVFDLAILANNYGRTLGGRPIPEPATLTLLGLGLAGALLRRRRGARR